MPSATAADVASTATGPGDCTVRAALKGMSPQMIPQIHVDVGGRNAYLGPDYATTDLRITRRLYLRPRYQLELVVEGFDVMNRDSQRIIITDDGVNSTASYFLRLDKAIGIRYFPACYQRPEL